MVKVPRFIRDIAVVIAIFVFMSVTGWICSESGVMGNYPPVTTRFVFQAQVIDPNGTAVPDQTVYMIACLQKPAGWFTPARYLDNTSLTATTDKGGFVDIWTDNFTLTRDDIIWMGVSTNESLLASDLDALAFDPGRIGKWSRYNYSDIARPGPAASGYARNFVVRNSDGRMIDISQFYRESRMNFTGRMIDTFWYMDNRSWAYPLK